MPEDTGSQRDVVEALMVPSGKSHNSPAVTFRKRRILMKPCLLSTLAPSVAIAGMALILGCGDESKKIGAGPTVPSVTPAADSAEATDVPGGANALAAISEPLPMITKAPSLSPAAEQVVQLAQARVGDDVLLAYIERSPSDFNVQVQEILYLHDLGLSAPVISAMVRHDQASPAPASNANEQESLTASNPSGRSPYGTTASPAGVNSAPAESPEPNTVSLGAETPQTSTAEGPPAQSVTYNYFYDNLAPYGNWVQDVDYGWCWQPTVAVVNTGWRPYCDSGRWQWTDCGWYWQSSYSWGSIPFHYGRWCNRPSGWAWVPGTVWGPSWVTWCNSGSYCGWAPLPPACGYAAGVGLTFGGGSVGVSFNFGLGHNCWTFVPAGYVCNYSPWYYALPASRVPAIINNGTIVNNYVRGSGNNVVVNVGPGIGHIASVSRDEIRKVSLRDVNAASGRTIRADRLDRAGGTLAVFRPTLPQQAPAPPQHILARQQEVRRNSEALVRSDVVKLARTETGGHATSAARSGASFAANARAMPTVSKSTQTVPVTVSSRNEIRGTGDGQSARYSSAPASRTAAVGSAPGYSSSNNGPTPAAARGEVRPGAANGSRSIQTPGNQPAAYHFELNTPATRTVTTPPAADPPQSFGQPANPSYRNGTRGPENVRPGFSTPSYSPAPSRGVQSRPVTLGFNPPATSFTPAPRAYTPPPAAPSRPINTPAARSAPAPSPLPAPAPSRSQPSSSSSSSSSRSGPNKPN